MNHAEQFLQAMEEVKHNLIKQSNATIKKDIITFKDGSKISYEPPKPQASVISFRHTITEVHVAFNCEDCTFCEFKYICPNYKGERC